MDDGDDHDGRASSSRHRRRGAGLPGMTINVAVLLLLSPDRQRPEKRSRVYRRPPERRARHCGGRDGGAGAMGPTPKEGGAGGSGTRRIRTGGCPCRMPVHYRTMGDQEGGEGATATGGGGSQGGRRTRRGGGEAVVGGFAAGVDDNGEDDDGIRRHQATTNPVMVTMAAVADNDGIGGRRRR